ncbi:MAG: hypothetical protein ACSLFD_05620 [Solirubrobacterales bacterium]
MSKLLTNLRASSESKEEGVVKGTIGWATGIALALSLMFCGTASAAASLSESMATDRFDRLGVRYQRHLTGDSYSRVVCDRTALNSFSCKAKWKVRAVSDEGVRTRFTFMARGTVVRHADETISMGRFVKWETARGTTRKTSSVFIQATEPIPLR